VENDFPGQRPLAALYGVAHTFFGTCAPKNFEEMQTRTFSYKAKSHKQGRNGGARGAQIPWAPSHYGSPNHCRGVEKFQKCHKYFLQYSEFASERAQVRTWGRQTCFLPRAPSNLVTPLHISAKFGVSKVILCRCGCPDFNKRICNCSMIVPRIRGGSRGWGDRSP